ncbi:MAG: flagellar basal body-associated FliL family protein [Armatimonadota bacterium]
MIAAIVVALVVVGAGGLVLGQKMMNKGKSDKGAAASKQGEKDSGGEKKSTSDTTGDKAADKTKEGGDGAVVDLGEFLVNLEGGTESRFLRAEVSVRLSGLPTAEKKGEGGAASVEKLPASDLAVARDCVNTVLSSGVFQQLRTAPGREKLKQDVLAKLQKSLVKYDVQDVLFTSFVMQ